MFRYLSICILYVIRILQALFSAFCLKKRPAHAYSAQYTLIIIIWFGYKISVAGTFNWYKINNMIWEVCRTKISIQSNLKEELRTEVLIISTLYH